jgi:hypothetical protein
MITTFKNSLYAISLALLLSLSFVGGVHAGSEEFENEANSKINKVEKQIADLRSMIEDAQEQNIYTSYYEDDLDDAEDFYENALEEDAKEDWDDALELADAAYDILDDTIDDLDDELSLDAKAEIKIAEDLIELAEEALDDTDRDDLDYDDADEILDQAKDVFYDAENDFEKKDYYDAEQFARDAAELAEEVFDELKVKIEDYLPEEKEMEEVEEEEEEEMEEVEEEEEEEMEEVEEEEEMEEVEEEEEEEKNISEMEEQISKLMQLIELLTEILNLKLQLTS